MKLKERKEEKFFKQSRNFGKRIYTALRNRRSKIFFLIVLILIIFGIGILFGLMITKFFGTLDNPSEKAIDIIHYVGINGLRDLKTKIEGIKRENIKIPLNYLKGQFSNPKKMVIDISFEDFQKIEFKRQQALEQKHLVTSGEDFVPATILYNGEEYRADIRLKGDQEDHWEGKRWSFRIEIKDGKTLEGMRVFSIQKPSTRNYITEFLYHQDLKKEGLIGLRYDFVEIIINGERKGIYAMEEHFGKELIENNDRREGVIIKFSEDFTRERWGEINVSYEKQLEVFYASEIEVFNDGKVLEDPVLYSQFIQAKNILKAFRRQDLKTSEAFDVDKTATYFAINTLFGSAHASYWNNIRFYFNPITSKLEPIGYDSAGRAIADNSMDEYLLDEYSPKCLSFEKGDECSKEPGKLSDLIFKDPVFFEAYLKEIDRLSEEKYLDEFFGEHNEDIEKFTNIIHKDEPLYYFPKEVFYENQKLMKEKLETADDIKVNFVGSEDGKIIIQAEGTDEIPVRVLNLNYNEIVFEKISGVSLLQPKFPEVNKIETFEFSIPEDFVWQDNFVNETNITYTLLGSTEIKQKPISNFPYVKEEFEENDFVRQELNLSSFEFLNIEESSKSIYIKKGAWKLEQSLIIPKDFTVFCEEGTTLDLTQKSSILSYSPLYFEGEKENPIYIISSDKTGEGLAVLNAKKNSVLKNVIFSDLTNPVKEGWVLTGGVTFYESPIILENVVIKGINAEDSLDLVRSKYEIKNSIFENCFSDCLDDDFGEGIIKNSVFINCGNDCVDFSGTKVDIESLEIIDAGDKGVSIGEKSNLTINNLSIKGEKKQISIGIASKDLSFVFVKGVLMENVKYGFAAYQKKPEFGPSSILAENLNFLNVKNKYILEKESHLRIDGILILSQEEDVYKKLYPDEK